jgi:hypothetical protein
MFSEYPGLGAFRETGSNFPASWAKPEEPIIRVIKINALFSFLFSPLATILCLTVYSKKL